MENLRKHINQCFEIIERKLERGSLESWNTDDFSFNSRPVSTGLPNSVVFDYDASAANDASKIEIQQNWSLMISSLRKMMSNIQTQDWLGIIEKEPRPIYLDQSIILKEDRMTITPEIVASYNRMFF